VIQAAYQALLQPLGLEGAGYFSDPRIVVWRTLPDRENCTLDVAWPDGRPVRLHIKRYPGRWGHLAEAEATALQSLERCGIACAPLVASGRLPDGRGFIVTEDLAGFAPADKLIAGGLPFETLLGPTAELAAKLHSAGFHHRDLYLCHFFCRVQETKVEVKLIDAARVRRLPGWPMTSRWIVKDLAQFCYSTMQLPIPDVRRSEWLTHYEAGRGVTLPHPMRRRIGKKAYRIAVHDLNLNRRQPTRHVPLKVP
jgi:hypothetical protein